MGAGGLACMLEDTFRRPVNWRRVKLEGNEEREREKDR